MNFMSIGGILCEWEINFLIVGRRFFKLFNFVNRVRLWCRSFGGMYLLLDWENGRSWVSGGS